MGLEGAQTMRRPTLRRGRAVAITTLLTLVAAAAACAPGPDSWLPTTPAPVPDATYQLGELAEVDCGSVTACTAVGAELVADYDGTWGAAATPARRFISVSCLPDGSGCLGLDGDFRSKIVRLPDTTVYQTDIQATAISCTGPDFCAVIGYEQGRNGVVALMYDGATWTKTALSRPNPEAGPSAIDCVTSTFCVAVGGNVFPVTGPAVIWQWDGTAWTMTTHGTNGYLSDVSCASASTCVAGGYGADRLRDPLFRRWDGTTWSPWTAPPAGAYTVSKISCPTGSSCALLLWRHEVGEHTARWDGSTWSETRLDSFHARDIACPAADACHVVGSVNRLAKAVSYLEGDGASWGPPGFLPVAGRPMASFSDVSCLADGACVAVGGQTDGTATRALAQRWDGTRWTPLPDPGPQVGRPELTLSSVACASATWCMATGYAGPDHVRTRPVVLLRWQDGRWHEDPLTGDRPSTTGDVRLACVGTGFCMAVAGSDALRWDGTAWHPSDFPVEPTGGGLACGSATSCIVTGGDTAYHWNGVAWQATSLADLIGVTDPPVGGFVSTDVSEPSCPAADACIVFATVSVFDDSSLPLVHTGLRWDGTAWSAVWSDGWHPYRSEPVPSDLSCASADRCLAMDGTWSFDGTTWERRRPAAPPGAVWTGLSCYGRRCMAVGGNRVVADDPAAGTTPVVSRYAL